MFSLVSGEHMSISESTRWLGSEEAKDIWTEARGVTIPEADTQCDLHPLHSHCDYLLHQLATLSITHVPIGRSTFRH